MLFQPQEATGDLNLIFFVIHDTVQIRKKLLF